ncbi:MAG: TolB family protein [Blastocatellia bacterium]
MRLTTNEAEDINPVWSPDGRWIAVVSRTCAPGADKQLSEVARLARGAERYLPGLAVSPDGRSLLYCQMDRSGSDIMMVENFR